MPQCIPEKKAGILTYLEFPKPLVHLAVPDCTSQDLRGSFSSVPFLGFSIVNREPCKEKAFLTCFHRKERVDRAIRLDCHVRESSIWQADGPDPYAIAKESLGTV